jgi:hypothetical protein
MKQIASSLTGLREAQALKDAIDEAMLLKERPVDWILDEAAGIVSNAAVRIHGLRMELGRVANSQARKNAGNPKMQPAAEHEARMRNLARVLDAARDSLYEVANAIRDAD